MSAEVFISYARDDRERVMPLVDRLRQSGISVWVDEGGITSTEANGFLVGKEIVEAIRHAKGFVLVATKSSFDSKNVVKEVAIASEWDKAILPVYLEPVQVPDTLHLTSSLVIQHVEYYAGREMEAFQGMIASLNQLGSTPAPLMMPMQQRLPNPAHRRASSTTNIGQEPARDLVVGAGSVWAGIGGVS